MTVTLHWWVIPLVTWLVGLGGLVLYWSGEMSRDRYGIASLVFLLCACLWTIPVLVISLIYSVVFT